MPPLALDLKVLRAVLASEAGELRLDVGRLLMARVAAIGEDGSGTLALAGALLEAKLPEGLSVGQELKLAVRELTPDKVVLAIQDEQAQSQAQAQPEIPVVPPFAPFVPMPHGGTLRVQERTRPRSRSTRRPDGSHALSLRYDTESLGAIDMRFLLGPGGGLKLSITVQAGAPLRSASAAAQTLEAALTNTISGPVTVSVSGRHEPLEVFA